MVRTLQEIITTKDTLIFFVAKFGVFHKSDKSILHSHQQSKLYFQGKFNFLPPTVANIKSEQSGKLPGVVIIGNLARKELLWWIENIRLSNSRKIQ